MIVDLPTPDDPSSATVWPGRNTGGGNRALLRAQLNAPGTSAAIRVPR